MMDTALLQIEEVEVAVAIETMVVETTEEVVERKIWETEGTQEVIIAE